MNILTRMCISLDGYITTPEGRPVQLADPDFSPEKYGFVEFQRTLSAVLMGRTTFEPALSAPRWPWPDLGVYVLASHRPEGTPDHVVTDSDPEALLEQLPEEGDVHLVGGPKTIEAFRALGALDKLGLIVLPLMVGDGMRLTPALSTDTGLTLETERSLAGGLVEIVYSLRT
jgi:dihydrofolate reductase